MNRRLRPLGPLLGLGVCLSVAGCGPRVPLSSGGGETGGTDDDADDDYEEPPPGIPSTTTQAPTPAGSSTTSPGSGPLASTGDDFASTGFAGSGSSSTGWSSIEELCENVHSESHTCVTQSDDTWMLIGSDSGVLCDIEPLIQNLAEDSVALAWNGEFAMFCLPTPMPQIFEEWPGGFNRTSALPCTHIFDFAGQLAVVVPGDVGSRLTIYPDAAAMYGGQMLWEAPVDIQGTRVGSGAGKIYSTNDRDPVVTITELGSDAPTISTLLLNRGVEPINGIDRVDDALFILSERTLDQYDHETGQLLIRQGLATGHQFEPRGLSCL